MTEPAWIRMISDEEANAALCAVFDTARTPHGTLDNVMRGAFAAPGDHDRPTSRSTAASFTAMTTRYRSGFLRLWPAMSAFSTPADTACCITGPMPAD